MKKLIVCASVAVAACAVNAASYIWGFGAADYEDINGGRDTAAGVYTGGKAFLYLGVVTASSSAFNLNNATYVTSATFDDLTYLYGYQNTSSPLSSEIVPSVDAGQKYSLILVDKDTSDLSTYTGNYVLYNTGTSTRGEIPGQTVSYYAEFTNNTAIAAADWKTMAVPEPTSGLLLLLGVAGLALKRKHA